jgi:hypothetical protein
MDYRPWRGIKALPGSDKAFAQMQALWRFLSNDRVSPIDLVKPLLALAYEDCRDDCDDYVLVMHDFVSITGTITARLIVCR